MKKIAVIVAGGSGTRMGGNIPKQFALLRGKPLLYYSLKTFLAAYTDLKVILVLPADHLDRGEKIVSDWFDPERVAITAGGTTRFESVRNGLKLAEEDSIIFVQDGVRCLLSADLIHRCFQQAVEKGSAIPAITSRDSIRLIDGEQSRPFDRNRVMLIQTPQTFQGKILLPAYRLEYREEFTDDAGVVEANGNNISLIEGEENNIKITRPADLLMAEKLLEANPDS